MEGRQRSKDIGRQTSVCCNLDHRRLKRNAKSSLPARQGYIDALSSTKLNPKLLTETFEDYMRSIKSNDLEEINLSLYQKVSVAVRTTREYNPIGPHPDHKSTPLKSLGRSDYALLYVIYKHWKGEKVNINEIGSLNLCKTFLLLSLLNRKHNIGLIYKFIYKETGFVSERH